MNDEQDEPNKPSRFTKASVCAEEWISYYRFLHERLPTIEQLVIMSGVSASTAQRELEAHRTKKTLRPDE